MTLQCYLTAEKRLMGLWPHRPDERLATTMVLAGAEVGVGAVAAASPTVTVRATVGYWSGAGVVHDWLDARLGCQLHDGAEVLIDRDVLAELHRHAFAQMAAWPEGNVEDPDSWNAALLQLGRVLADPDLAGCDFYWRSSF